MKIEVVENYQGLKMLKVIKFFNLICQIKKMLELMLSF